MSITIESKIHFANGRDGRKRLKNGPKARSAAPPPVPRIARLLALAVHFEELIRQGIVRDYSDLARLGGVSQPRMTQIMNLLNLPPWRQEELLFLEGTAKGRDRITERDVRKETQTSLWKPLA